MISRVGLGGCPPRPPTDPDSRVEDASGSSRRRFAVPHTIPPPYGDTLGGPMPSAWFRLPVHNAAPPSLQWVREGPFPSFDATMGRSDSLPFLSPPFVAFGRRYHPCAVFAPSGRARDRGLRGVDVPVPEPGMSVETAGSLRFPSDPRVPAPCSWTPVGPRKPLQCLGAAPARVHNAGSRERESRGSIARHRDSLTLLRSGGHPPPRQTRFRLLARLCRAGFSPAGSR